VYTCTSLTRSLAEHRQLAAMPSPTSRSNVLLLLLIWHTAISRLARCNDERRTSRTTSPARPCTCRQLYWPSARQSALGAVRIVPTFSPCMLLSRLLQVLQRLLDLPDELEQRVSGKNTSCRQFCLTLVHTTVPLHDRHCRPYPRLGQAPTTAS